MKKHRKKTFRKKTFRKKHKKNHTRHKKSRKAGFPNQPYKQTPDHSGTLNRGYVDDKADDHRTHNTHIVDTHTHTGTYSHATVVGANGVRYHWGMQRRGNQFVGPTYWSNPPTATLPMNIWEELLETWEKMK